MRTRILYGALLTLLLAGCVKEREVSLPKDGIVLNLVIEEQQTKATREGDANRNENLIGNTVDLFFYDESTLDIKKEVLGAICSGTLVQIQTNPNDIESIFGTIAVGAHCGVYVVANFSGSYQGTPGSRTLTDIKSSLLPAPNWETLPQASFVMTGEKQLTLGNAQGSTPVYDTVNLERVAAKVTFDVTVAESGIENGAWIPDTRNMSVYMVYAMRKATLGAETVPVPATASMTYGSDETIVYSQYRDKILYNTGTTKRRARGVNIVDTPVYSTDHDGNAYPFYTYPVRWDVGSSMEPYMKLIIPWTYGNTTRKYFYKIPFHENHLDRNHWYHISIDVQILGTEQADPPRVDIHYSIADWHGSMDNATAEDITSVTSVPATVIAARYLTVPTTEYVLYDEEDLVIPLMSSHDIEVVGFNVDTDNAYKPAHIDNDANYIGTNVSIYNPFLNTLNTSAVNAVHPNYANDPPTAVVSNSGWTITPNGRTSITIHHGLNRNMDDANFDVAPYTLRFRIRHASETDNYFTDVIVEQRPSIIIKPQRNSDNGEVLSSGTGRGVGHTAEDGYVFVNGTRTNSDMSSNRTNTNFNMYIVETSVLPASGVLSSYVLGDPRQENAINTISGMTFTSGKDIAGGANRTMSNYYPSAEDEDHSVFIAPSFRIASSFGTSSYMNRNTAVHRCATYQEDGYPAGRWRLPTRAEIVYMVTLSQKGKIPALFSPESAVKYGGYWCSSGAVFPLTDGSLEYRDLATAMSMTVYTVNNQGRDQELGTGVQWARCVYDEWFWSDTTHETATKTEWTWGDEARNTVRKK